MSERNLALAYAVKRRAKLKPMLESAAPAIEEAAPAPEPIAEEPVVETQEERVARVMQDFRMRGLKK